MGDITIREGDPVFRYQIDERGVVSVQRVTEYSLPDGTRIGEDNWRGTLDPDADVEGQPEEVRAIVRAARTDARKARWKAEKAQELAEALALDTAAERGPR